MKRVLPYVINLVFLLSLVGMDAGPARGCTISVQETTANQATADELTQARLDDLQARVQSGDLTAENKETCQSLLQSVAANLTRIEANKKETQQNTAKAKSASERAESLKSELATLREKADEPISAPANTTLSSAVEQAQTELQSLQNDLNVARGQSSDRLNRILQIRTAIAAAEKQIKDAQAELNKSPAESEPARVTECRTLLLDSQIAVAETEIPKLQSETQWYESSQLAGVNTARIELLNAKITAMRKKINVFETLLKEERQEKAEDFIGRAKQDVEQAPPLLKPFAEETAAIAQQASDQLKPLADAVNREKKLNGELAELEARVASTKKRVNQPGSSGSKGSYLRRQLTDLPYRYGARSEQRQQEIEKTQDRIFDEKDFRDALLVEELPASLAETIAAAPADQQPALKQRAQEMVELRKKLLNLSISNDEEYMETLFDIETTEKQLIAETDEFRDYINERILWIKSNQFLFSQLQIDDSDWQIFDSGNWVEIGQYLLDDMLRNPVGYLVVALVMLIVLLRRRKIKERIRHYGEIVSRGSATSFAPTLKATALTLVATAALPLVLMFLGWRLLAADSQTSIAVAVGRTLFFAATMYFPLEFVRKCCRPFGVAERHFQWSSEAIHKIKSQFDWFVPTATILFSLFGLFYLVDQDHRGDAVERLLYILLLVTVCVLIYRLLHPEKGIFKQTFSARPEWWVAKTSWIWFSLLILAPLFLISMVVYGYYYSAIQMISRVYYSFVVLLSVEFSRALIARFVSLSQRKAQIEQAKQRYKQLTEAAIKQQTDSERTVEAEAMIAEESRAVLEENVLRSRKLIRACALIGWVVSLWLIWIDVVPALKGLDRFELWETTVQVDEPSVASLSLTPAGTPAPAEAEAPAGDTDPANAAAKQTVVKPVTLRHLLIAMFFLAITIFFVRNLPGFFELLFLQYLPVEPSLRYAFKTIASYVILLVGIVIACRTLSIGWSQIQWLATALTFGLAFGLQEIFANFIAGIILLLERPIRIGDIITASDVTGTVTKIRIRATTIMDFDRKEYIVPNKEFITGRVMNWTLTDQVNRLTLQVGVAYGSDVERAKQILMELCKSHPAVVDEPSTIVTFEEFGDSTLNLVIRTYVKDYSSRFDTVDQLHTAINRRFAEEGLEIAFPQRDLHIRSIPSEMIKQLDPE